MSYGNAYNLKETLEYDFTQERDFRKSEFVCSLIILLIVIVIYECYSAGIDIFLLFR